MKTKNDIGLLVLRVAIALTMIFYGIDKLIYGIEFIQSLMDKYHLPSFIGYGVFVGEIIAPILIIVGFRTKLAGIVFAINCLAAIVLGRLQDVLVLNEYGGWSVDLIFIYLIFGIATFFTGAGKYAISTQNKYD